MAIQLFGHDPEVMRSAAARVAEIGADLIDINMGCPVPKVCKTGAGAALVKDPDAAVAVARAAREGSGLPVTVKLRAEGVETARRLVEEAGVAGITFHPRTVKVRHKGRPDYDLAARVIAELPVPVILSGGMDDADHIRWAFEHTGAAAIMLARGSLGNPWLFEQVLGTRDAAPGRDEVLEEWAWVVDRAEEHLGARARDPLPAQVPPLVRRAPRRGPRPPGRAPARRDAGRGAGPDRRARGPRRRRLIQPLTA